MGHWYTANHKTLLNETEDLSKYKDVLYLSCQTVLRLQYAQIDQQIQLDPYKNPSCPPP